MRAETPVYYDPYDYAIDADPCPVWKRLRDEVPVYCNEKHGGTHCIGAALARLEGTVALTETLRRYPTWEVDESRLERVHTATVRGYSSVPMRVHSRS